MRRAAIVGLGQVSAAGTGFQALEGTLQSGRRPAPTWLDCYGPMGRSSVPLLRPNVDETRRLFDPRALRRLDDFSLCAAGAASLALDDAGVTSPDRQRIGVVLATGYGAIRTSFDFLDDVIDKGDRRGSPILFSRSVHGAPASTISSLLDVRGPTVTITKPRGAWTEALWLGLDWLHEEVVDLVLVCAADAYHEVLGYRLLVDGGWAEDGTMRPLDFDEPSFVPGEAFSAMLLGHPRRQPPRWGEIEEPSEPSPPQELRIDPSCPLLLAASGRREDAPAYKVVAQTAGGVAAYSPLWGGTPTSEAMTCIVAATSLKRSHIFEMQSPVARSEGVPPLAPSLAAGASAIQCCSVSAGLNAQVVTISRPKGTP